MYIHFYDKSKKKRTLEVPDDTDLNKQGELSAMIYNETGIEVCSAILTEHDHIPMDQPTPPDFTPDPEPMVG